MVEQPPQLRAVSEHCHMKYSLYWVCAQQVPALSGSESLLGNIELEDSIVSHRVLVALCIR